MTFIKKSIGLSIALAFGAVCLQAQSAAEIIQKNIEVTGGLVNWKKLNTISLTGKLVLSLKEAYPVKILQARPNLSRTSIFTNGKEVITDGFDGRRGYEMNFSSGKLVPNQSYQPEFFDNDFLDFEKKGFTATLAGKETVAGQECYKVVLTKNVNKDVYYFNTKSYLLVKEERGSEILSYSDYRKVNQLLFPFRIETTDTAAKSDFVLIFDKIITNAALPSNTFNFTK